MANGEPFNPDKMTAASWSYPLGTVVRVMATSVGGETRSVVVTITDRGPARKHVQKGRIIDLARAAFGRLAHPEVGLLEVSVESVP